jgi:hypothetical protein
MFKCINSLDILLFHHPDPWRNGSASDSRSEGCVFDSRRVQTPDPNPVLFFIFFFGLPVCLSHTKAQPIVNKLAHGPASTTWEPKPSTPFWNHSLSVPQAPTSPPFRIRTNTKPREREADEASRTSPASSPFPPPSRSHGDRHAEDQGHRGRGNDPYLVFAALGSPVDPSRWAVDLCVGHLIALEFPKLFVLKWVSADSVWLWPARLCLLLRFD